MGLSAAIVAPSMTALLAVNWRVRTAFDGITVLVHLGAALRALGQLRQFFLAQIALIAPATHRQSPALFVVNLTTTGTDSNG